MSGFAQEHLSAARMLAAYSQEQQAVGAFKQLNEDYAAQYLDFVLRSSAITPLPAWWCASPRRWYWRSAAC